MRVNCISCGHRFELDRAYDDYSGYVKCSICRGMLDITTVNGQVKSVRPPNAAPAVIHPQESHVHPRIVSAQNAQRTEAA